MERRILIMVQEIDKNTDVLSYLISISSKNTVPVHEPLPFGNSVYSVITKKRLREVAVQYFARTKSRYTFIFDVTNPTNYKTILPDPVFQRLFFHYDYEQNKPVTINNVDDLTMDDLLDLITSRGGYDKLTADEKNRLIELRK